MTTRWRYLVKIGFRFTDLTIPYAERRDDAVARFRSHPGLPDQERLDGLLDLLAVAPDVATFDSTWTALYDWADEHGVWVDIFCDDPDS